MKTIATNRAPKAIGPYSQGIIHSGTIYLSGQIPMDPDTGAIVGNDIRSQTQQVLANIGVLLQEAGSSFSSVIKTTCFLADMNDFAAFNELYAEKFTKNPARSCIAAKALPKNVLVEIELIAAIEA